MIEKLSIYIRNKPLFSTILAAVILSGLWTVFWLFVFFGSTWILGYETAKSAFITAFWFSVAAESTIRWAENTDFIAKLSKPNAKNPKGDNQDFKFAKAAVCQLCLLVIVFGYLFLAHRVPEVFGIDGGQSFGGQSTNTLEGLKLMLINWWKGLVSPAITISLLVGFVFRVIIYKRSHK